MITVPAAPGLPPPSAERAAPAYLMRRVAAWFLAAHMGAVMAATCVWMTALGPPPAAAPSKPPGQQEGQEP